MNYEKNSRVGSLRGRGHRIFRFVQQDKSRAVSRSASPAVFLSAGGARPQRWAQVRQPPENLSVTTNLQAGPTDDRRCSADEPLTRDHSPIVRRHDRSVKTGSLVLCSQYT